MKAIRGIGCPSLFPLPHLLLCFQTGSPCVALAGLGTCYVKSGWHQKSSTCFWLPNAEVNGMCSASPHILGQGFSLNLELIGQPRICLPVSSAEIHNLMLLCWLPGILTQVLICEWQALSLLSHLPSPTRSFFSSLTQQVSLRHLVMEPFPWGDLSRGLPPP